MSDQFKDNARQRLLQEHSFNEMGVWEIRGEDPNCDWGGPHHQPHLDTVEGRFGEVVEYALSLGGFFSWGGGGSIKKLGPIKKITSESMKRRAELTQRRAELQKEIEAINDELGEKD